MDKKDMGALFCASLVLWEAGDFALTGEKPPLPAGQPHIEFPAWSQGGLKDAQFPTLGAITTSGTTSSASASTAFQMFPPAGLWTTSR